jgi:hypothetical protein
MKIRLRFALILAFVIGATATIILFNTHRPRLLIIHSHGSETAQIRTINRGLRDELRSKTHFSIRWYYSGLDTMASKQLAEAESLRVRKLVSALQPNVILAVGDEAQEYVSRHYANDSRIKIVYCAVHEDVVPYGLDHAANATGTLMIPPLDALRDVLMEISHQLGLARPLRVFHVGDKSDDVKDDGTYMAGNDWGDVNFIGNEYVGTFEDWKAAVGRAAKRADVILTSDYQDLSRSSTDQTLVPGREVVDWTVSHAAVPVVGTRSQYVWDGGMLAVGASTYEQGREAGAIAISLLEQHVSPSDIPARTPKGFVVAANESRLRERNLHLPDVYQALARASNNYFQ